MRRLPARLLPLFALSALPLSAAEPLIKDGDRVVLIGGTAVEREQRYGYWEYALTAAQPKAKVTFRNLGWSGDTVWGDARAGFDDAAKGFKRLVELATELKPTLIVLNYGANEAHAGPAGSEKFVAQYNKLLDALAPTKARFVLAKPLPIQPHVGKFSDAAGLQKNLDLYSQAIDTIAAERKLSSVTLADFKPYEVRAMTSPPIGNGTPVTDNGVHLTEFGYRATARDVAGAFDLASPDQALVAITAPQTADAKGASAIVIPPPPGKGDEGPAAWTITRSILPAPDGPASAGSPSSGVWFRFPSVRVTHKALPPGDWALLVDGKPHGAGPADKWARGEVETGWLADEHQADELLAAIRAKNELYFYRWRPQNETYLFGFRKHEQGKNAKEVAEFDPLVAKMEDKIHELKQPKPHTYQWVPAVKK